MSTLVTGSNGFLGRALVKRLLGAGQQDVVCLVRAGSNRKRLDAVLAQYPSLNPRVLVGSLARVDDARTAIDGASAIYHLAASLSGAAADMYLNTVVTSRNLLEAVTELPTPPKVVLISSFGVYGVADLPRGSLVDEQTPLEASPKLRDLYSQTKLRQEQLFWEYKKNSDYPLVVLRPGVIYGSEGSRLSARVGLQLPGLFLFLGGDNLLPLTYVDNCADAIAVAGSSDAALGQVYNVVDDQMPTCREYFKRYVREVEKRRSIRVPYFALRFGSSMVRKYHHHSKGQLPDIFTPYKSATMWGGNRFDNSRLKSIGWRQPISTDSGIDATFRAFRQAQN